MTIISSKYDHFCYSDFVSANWFDVLDPESSIARIQIWMGTSPGADDILTARDVHGSTSATFVPDNAPAGRYYTTLRVWNNAGRSNGRH